MKQTEQDRSHKHNKYEEETQKVIVKSVKSKTPRDMKRLLRNRENKNQLINPMF